MVQISVDESFSAVEASIRIVIVNYRTSDDLDACLNSLRQHPPSYSYDVVVVHNEVTLPDMVVAARYCGLPWQMASLEWDRNEGYATACNEAASWHWLNLEVEREAKPTSPVIGLFNADVLFTPGVIDDCFEALMSNPDWGVVGPRQMDEQGKITHAGIFGTRAQPHLRGFKERAGDRYTEVDDTAVSVSGSAYFIKRSLWDQLTACALYQLVAPNAVGAFLPTKHYWNETWTSYHAVEHESPTGQPWKIAYLGSSTMVHKWHRASPVGGYGEQHISEDQAMFRRACDIHDIPHD